MKTKLLIVDDDEEIRTQMKWALGKDHEVVVAGDRTGAVEAFQREGPDLVLLDLGLPPEPNSPVEGLAALTAILEIDPSSKILVISGQGDKDCALQAIGAGACDFLLKPIQMEELRFLVQRQIYVADLERRFSNMQASRRAQSFEGIYGGSPTIRRVFSLVEKVAPSDAPVLILGESGTGKEMVARAIHKRSNRAGKPFIAINCSAIPENLIESELFGSEKGAFTGANARRVGMIEGAAGGTLFLDEIGDLPASVQVKLLRFLQDKRVQRVGGREEIAIDARIIAATNADLHSGIAKGEFREDLYFRLAVVVLELPPLREREDDAGMLAEEFLQQFAAQNGNKRLSFTSEALRAVGRYHWPGNVRELQNRIQRAVVLSENNRITVQDLDLHELTDTLAPTTLREARDRVEKELIEHALRRHKGKISPAAEELGVSRPTLYGLLSKLGIERHVGGADDPNPAS